MRSMGSKIVCRNAHWSGTGTETGIRIHCFLLCQYHSLSPLLAQCSVITPSGVKDPIDIHVDLINIASVSHSHEILVSVGMP